MKDVNFHLFWISERVRRRELGSFGWGELVSGRVLCEFHSFVLCVADERELWFFFEIYALCIILDIN